MEAQTAMQMAEGVAAGMRVVETLVAFEAALLAVD